MFEQEETLHLLELIESTLSIIEERCKEIATVDDFFTFRPRYDFNG